MGLNNMKLLIILLFSVLTSSLNGESLTNTEVIKSKIKFTEQYEILTIIKIKGEFYKGLGKSHNLSISKSKSYMDCLFNYTNNKPISTWEKFKWVTFPKWIKLKN